MNMDCSSLIQQMLTYSEEMVLTKRNGRKRFMWPNPRIWSKGFVVVVVVVVVVKRTSKTLNRSDALVYRE